MVSAPTEKPGVRRMADIIDIDAHKPHVVCELVDLKCFHRWIGVYPEDTLLKQIHCPHCGAAGYCIILEEIEE